MSKGVGKLHFWGQRERPMTPRELAARVPIIGKGRSKEDREFNHHSIYVATSGKAKPITSVTEVEHRADQTIWRIDMPDEKGQQLTHLFGRTATREDPEGIRAAIHPNTDFTGRCPDGSDLFYIPRTLPRTAIGGLRRFNGRSVTPAYVNNPDQRQIYQETSYPWCCVGKVITSEGKVGSGALVGPNIMVTAGHAVPSNLQPNSWWMLFVSDYFDFSFGPFSVTLGAPSYVSDVKGYAPPGNVAGYDWVICKLYEPLGNSLGYFGFNSYSSDWENENVWTVAGYPTDVAHGERPSWEGGVSILDDDEDSNDGQELESENSDISLGNSGGPIWAWWGSDPRVIGVVSGMEREDNGPLRGHQDNNIFASGSGFGNLIAWGRSNW